MNSVCTAKQEQLDEDDDSEDEKELWEGNKENGKEC